MNTVQAFIWNVGTYGLVLRESAKWTNRKVQSTDTVIGAEWLVVVKRVSEKKTERRSHSIQFYEVLRYINQCLIKWVRRSYKKKNTRSRAEHWLGAVARRDRNLFAHWKFGILPSVGEGAV